MLTTGNVDKTMPEVESERSEIVGGGWKLVSEQRIYATKVRDGTSKKDFKNPEITRNS